MKITVHRYDRSVAVTISEAGKTRCYWCEKLDDKWFAYHNPAKATKRLKPIVRDCIKEFLK